jgi:hypothetical protein
VNKLKAFLFSKEVHPMPKGVKTREVVKDIKVLDKAASGTAHAKNAFIRSKESSEATQAPIHHSPNEYAADHTTNGIKGIASSIARRLRKPHKKTADNINKAKESFQKAGRLLPKQRKQAAGQAQKTANGAKQTADTLKTKGYGAYLWT